MHYKSFIAGLAAAGLALTGYYLGIDSGSNQNVYRPRVAEEIRYEKPIKQEKRIKTIEKPGSISYLNLKRKQPVRSKRVDDSSNNTSYDYMKRILRKKGRFIVDDNVGKEGKEWLSSYMKAVLEAREDADPFFIRSKNSVVNRKAEKGKAFSETEKKQNLYVLISEGIQQTHLMEKLKL